MVSRSWYVDYIWHATQEKAGMPPRHYQNGGCWVSPPNGFYSFEALDQNTCENRVHIWLIYQVTVYWPLPNHSSPCRARSIISNVDCAIFFSPRADKKKSPRQTIAPSSCNHFRISHLLAGHLILSSALHWNLGIDIRSFVYHIKILVWSYIHSNPAGTDRQAGTMALEIQNENNDHLVQSSDPDHPANLIPDLCRRFYNWGWVTGTGGGVGDLGWMPKKQQLLRLILIEIFI